MLREERLERIEEYVNLNRYVSLDDLKERFGISRSTIRRDLDYLIESNRIAATRGGASTVNRGTKFEPSYLEKVKLNFDEKRRIAKAAVDHISPGDTIFLDSGTTATQMTEFISGISEVYVATNDLMTATALISCPNVALTVIGGDIRKGFYTTYGHFAASVLENYHFDKAFLCVDAFSIQHGAMITNTDEVDVKRAIVKASSEVIVLCDHTKFGRNAFVSVCPPSLIDHVITGTELSADQHRSILDNDISIELA